MNGDKMLIGTLNGFEFVVPTSGGKAGKGCNRTSTIQVRKDNCIVKQFRFKLADAASRSQAILKAKTYALDHAPLETIVKGGGY